MGDRGLGGSGGGVRWASALPTPLRDSGQFQLPIGVRPTPPGRTPFHPSRLAAARHVSDGCRFFGGGENPPLGPRTLRRQPEASPRPEFPPQFVDNGRMKTRAIAVLAGAICPALASADITLSSSQTLQLTFTDLTEQTTGVPVGRTGLQYDWSSAYSHAGSNAHPGDNFSSLSLGFTDTFTGSQPDDYAPSPGDGWVQAGESSFVIRHWATASTRAMNGRTLRFANTSPESTYILTGFVDVAMSGEIDSATDHHAWGNLNLSASVSFDDSVNSGSIIDVDYALAGRDEDGEYQLSQIPFTLTVLPEAGAIGANFAEIRLSTRSIGSAVLVPLPASSAVLCAATLFAVRRKTWFASR